MKPGARGNNGASLADEARTLIDELLAEQRQLTAVERFSQDHDDREFHVGERVYRTLLPARPPGKGEQYAFEVDLDKCSGCKACVSACHSLNGLEEDETWRSVGFLHGGTGAEPYQQTVTTACHHCVDPGCLNGCPVLAYDKDPNTGIVRHLDDQCIGCSYCVMKCPYEVPKYSSRLGIVRKCDMCAHRLKAGEAPACAQACPNEAIRITVVNQHEVKTRFREAPAAACPATEISKLEMGKLFLSDSPDPRITLPTTRYVSRRAVPENAVAAGHGGLRLDHPHWPLVFMLLLTQSAAGMVVAGAVLRLCSPSIDMRISTLAAFALLCAGLAASVLHLGRPLKAWRAFLGWRSSWLSREIIALSLFAAMTAPIVGAELFPALRGILGRDVFMPLAAIAGLGGVFASAMVYVDTRRPMWSPRLAFGNFFGATFLLGATFMSVAWGWSHAPLFRMQPAILIALILLTALFFWRRLELRIALSNPASPIHFNARVIQGLLPWTSRAGAWLFAGSSCFWLLAAGDWRQGAATWASFAALTAFSSEIIARYVFFAAGGSKRMPGGVAA